MNSTQKSGAMERIARCGMAVASVLALALAMAGASLAQSQPQASAAKPAAVAAKTAAPAAKSAPKGLHEGITIHGHWVIEVKNPDGSVARHVEFENSLDPGIYLPQGFPYAGGTLANAVTVPGGAALLAALLSGQAAEGANSWEIALVGSPALSGAGNAPCQFGGNGVPVLNSCFIFQGSSFACTAGGGSTAGIGCNLSATPSATGIQLSGSVTAGVAGSISEVATFVGNACANISSCFLPSSAQGVDSFTSATNFPGVPVSVNAGQSIAVTVQISFQ